jgi:hypothetical protein
MDNEKSILNVPIRNASKIPKNKNSYLYGVGFYYIPSWCFMKVKKEVTRSTRFIILYNIINNF